MNPAERWSSLQRLYHGALELPAAERAAFAARECGEDRDLHAELISLLDHEQESGTDFLDHAAVEVAARELAASESELPQLEPGSQIGPYRILEQIARGGMGVVYRAEQLSPVRRVVALKIIKPGMDTVEVVQRFGSERQALAVMDHPAIAKVFDAGSTPQGRPYFVMEYVVGTSIVAYCDRHKLTIPQRLRLFIAVCEGVQHAHFKSIVHRDLKPSNILVVEVDGKPAPKIIDFGIAKALLDRPVSGTFASLTSAGAIVGTPHYMSLEQAEGSDLDTRTDVYSLGVVLYELLAGALPIDFDETPVHRFAEKLRDEDAPKPSTKVRTGGGQAATHAGNVGIDVTALARQLRGDLDAITLKALEKDRDRRYSSPAGLAADLERYLRHEPVLAQPPGFAYRAGKYLRRHRIGVAMGAFTVALLAAAAIAQRVELQKTRRERDRADHATRFMTRMFEVADPGETRGNEVRARDILDKASLDIDKGLAGDPQLRAQMLDVMGTVYRNLGLYSKSEKLLRQAADVRRSVLGSDNAETLQSMAGLGEVLTLQSRFPEADKILRETVDRRRALLGAEHRDTLASKIALASLLNNQGKYEDAEKMNREVLDIARRRYGSADQLVTDASRLLAVDLSYEGRYADAEKSFREVLTNTRAALGPDHPRVLRDMSNLGASLLQLQRLSESDKVYSESLAGFRRIMGPEHPMTLLTMGNLGQVLARDGRHEQAAKLFREVYDAKRRTLGPENRSTLVTAGNLGGALRMTGKLTEAEQVVLENLPISRRVLGPTHIDTLVMAEAYGDILKRQLRYAESENVIRKLLEDRQKTLGGKHAHTALAHYKLACVLALAGKRDDALVHLRTSVELPLRYSLRDDLAQAPDLISLRGDERFSAILELARQQKAAAPAPK